MIVTIVLDSGGFMNDESTGSGPLDVGYFETSGAHDIEVAEGDKPLQPLPNSKLGNRNAIIDVEHRAADGTVKTGVTLSGSFQKYILKKNELYPADTPDFLASEYDCILRFHSGEFGSSNVRRRLFKERCLSDNADTGNKRPTRPIANDVVVHFHVKDGEEVRLRRDETDLWSSLSVGSATNLVRVKVLADESLDNKYFGKALKHRGPNYHCPNPDPPPMNGNDPKAGGGGGGGGNGGSPE